MKKLKLTKSQLDYINKPIPITGKNDDPIVWFILSLVGLAGIGYWVWIVLTK